MRQTESLIAPDFSGQSRQQFASAAERQLDERGVVAWVETVEGRLLFLGNVIAMQGGQQILPIRQPRIATHSSADEEHQSTGPSLADTTNWFWVEQAFNPTSP